MGGAAPSGDPPRYTVLSFDLDGTLVDTAAEIAEATNRALQAHGLARRSLQQISVHIGLGTRELMRRVMADVQVEQPAAAAGIRFDDVMSSLNRHYAETAGTLATPYAGAREGLQVLRQAGVRLACVTNKEYRHAVRVLAVTGLDPFFSLTVGGDSLPHKKPHASVLRYAVATLEGVLAQAAHVGDSHVDVEAARNAGVQAWAVPYGYNGGTPIAAARPDAVFATLLEVAERVTRRSAW